MKKSTIALMVIILLAAGGLTQSLFTVDQTKKALVLQLGRPVTKAPLGPGLHFKLPFVQNVVFFDARVLDFDGTPEDITTEDKKFMKVDSYSKWRISDPLRFYTQVRSIEGAVARLDDIIRSQLRVSLGRYTLIEVVSTKRVEIMDNVTKRCRELVKPYGIDILDVRIKRADLPPENERAIYGRMKAERTRQAKRYRSEGREAGARIRALADRDRTIILADARRKAAITRGEGDGQATKIYADALKSSPDFYEFLRSMEAYKTSLRHNTKYVLTPDSPYLKFFK